MCTGYTGSRANARYVIAITYARTTGWCAVALACEEGLRGARCGGPFRALRENYRYTRRTRELFRRGMEVTPADYRTNIYHEPLNTYRVVSAFVIGVVAGIGLALLNVHAIMR